MLLSGGDFSGGGSLGSRDGDVVGAGILAVFCPPFLEGKGARGIGQAVASRPFPFRLARKIVADYGYVPGQPERLM